MYIPDNNDAFATYSMETARRERLQQKNEAEGSADIELPWATVPNDYGTHDKKLYKEEIEMNENETLGTVTITIDSFIELVAKGTKSDVLAEVVKQSTYSMSREEIATILGFELPAVKKSEGEF